MTTLEALLKKAGKNRKANSIYDSRSSFLHYLKTVQGLNFGSK